MWTLLGNLLGGITGAVGKILPDRNRQNDAQSRINEAEVGGAPASILRLWRSFLGWMLSLLFCWEVAGRLIIIPLFFPGWSDHLPPSALNQIMTLLLGMLGLGFYQNLTLADVKGDILQNLSAGPLVAQDRVVLAVIAVQVPNFQHRSPGHGPSLLLLRSVFGSAWESRR